MREIRPSGLEGGVAFRAIPTPIFMAHSYVCQYVHCVFSTKRRERIIAPAFQDRLWP